MKKLLFISTVLTILLLPNTSATKSRTQVKKPIDYPKYSTTVELRITADDEKIKNEVYSYISREVRSLGDVRETNDNDGDWLIWIIAHKVHLATGEYVGFALSTVISRRCYMAEVFALLKKLDALSKKEKSYWPPNYALSGLYWLRHHKIVIGSQSNLQELCQKTIIDFDAEHLRPDRERYERFRQQQLIKQSTFQRAK